MKTRKRAKLDKPDSFSGFVSARVSASGEEIAPRAPDRAAARPMPGPARERLPFLSRFQRLCEAGIARDIAPRGSPAPVPLAPTSRACSEARRRPRPSIGPGNHESRFAKTLGLLGAYGHRSEATRFYDGTIMPTCGAWRACVELGNQTQNLRLSNSMQRVRSSKF